MNFKTKINNAQARATSMMSVAITDLMRKKDGLTTVEYAVAGALIAAAVVTAFSNLGLTVGNVLNNISNIIG